MQTQPKLHAHLHGVRARVERIKGNPAVSLAIVAAFLMVGVFVVYPLARVVIASLQTPAGLGLDTYVKVFSSWYMRRALYNTLLVGVLTSVIGVAIGFIFAFTMAKTDIPGKKILNLLAILPVVSPPFVGAVAILLLFGSNGLITTQLLGLYDFQIYGLKGLLFAQVMTFFPIAYLTLRGVLESIGSSLEDAAFDLGASRREVFTKVTLPLAAPGMASALLVLFIESLADFGNPLVLAGSQFPTLAVQAYLQITGMFDLAGGAALAVALLFPSLIAFVLQKYWLGKKRYVTVTGKPARNRSMAVSPAMKWTLFAFCIAVSGLVLLFYGVIAVGAFSRLWGVDHSFSLRNFEYVFNVGLEAVKDTLIVAVTSTPISGVLGMVLAFLIVRQRFVGRRALEFTSMLNYALPGTLVGIGYLLSFHQPPLALTGTLAILVLNFVFRYVPVGMQGGIASLQQIDPAIEEAAIDLGATTARTFGTVTLPLIAPAFFSGLIFAFIRAMTAISSAIFLVSADWQLMTVQILSQVGSGRLGVAAAFSVILIGVIVIAMFVIRWLVALTLGIRVKVNF